MNNMELVNVVCDPGTARHKAEANLEEQRCSDQVFIGSLQYWTDHPEQFTFAQGEYVQVRCQLYISTSVLRSQKT